MNSFFKSKPGPMETCIAWYKPEDWKLWKSSSHDEMCDTFEEWLEGANKAVEKFSRAGAVVHRVEIDFTKFAAWTQQRGLKCDGHNRSLYASEIFGKRYSKPYVPVNPMPTPKELNKLFRSYREQNPNEKVLGEIFEPYLRRPKGSVCPIFRTNEQGTEQFGSGVLVRIGEHHFLLTAAHVLDDSERYDLLIPGRDGLKGLNGHFAGMRMPSSGNRSDDRYDIAYVKLLKEELGMLHHDLMFLEAHECDTFDAVTAKDTYTVIGYPAEKSKTSSGEVATSIFSFSSEGVKDYRYKKIGCNLDHHLLVQFRRHRAFSYKTMQNSGVPDFAGLSGGGVFAWSKELPDPRALSQPKLTAIVTEYHVRSHVFVATRLSCYLACLKKNDPDLPIMGVEPRPPHNV
jgi:hypothetical protein